MKFPDGFENFSVKGLKKERSLEKTSLSVSGKLLGEKRKGPSGKE